MRMGKLANRLYNDFELDKKNYDFMGYLFNDKKELSYHHIQPRHYAGETTYENGSLLVRGTSHNYIHTIESIDFKIFLEISQELRKEHVEGITKERLIAIRQMLEFFEAKYEDQYTKKGLPIVKEEFTRRRIDLSGESKKRNG